MFKEIVDDAKQTPDIGRSQKFTMSTLCSGELKKIESIVRKGENAGYKHFSLCPQCFQKPLFPGVMKTQDSVVKG